MDEEAKVLLVALSDSHVAPKPNTKKGQIIQCNISPIPHQYTGISLNNFVIHQHCQIALKIDLALDDQISLEKPRSLYVSQNLKILILFVV